MKQDAENFQNLFEVPVLRFSLNNLSLELGQSVTESVLSFLTLALVRGPFWTSRPSMQVTLLPN